MASLLRRKPIATLCSIFCRQQHRRYTFRSLRNGPPPPEVANVTFDVGGRPTSIETGKLALLADGSVFISIGGTQVLSAVDCARSDHRLGSLPLTVPIISVFSDLSTCQEEQEEDKEDKDEAEYDEDEDEYEDMFYYDNNENENYLERRRMCFRRVRRPPCSRIIKDCISPLFPDGFYHRIQVKATVLSSDGVHDPDVLAGNATSAALTLSDIPWNGPIGVIRATVVEGKFIFNPTVDEISCSEVNLVYAYTKDKIVMVQRNGSKITAKDHETGLKLAHSEALKYIGPQIRLAEEVGRKKGVYKLSMVSDRTLQNTGSTAEGPIKTVFTDSICGKVCLSQEKLEAEDYRSDKIPPPAKMYNQGSRTGYSPPAPTVGRSRSGDAAASPPASIQYEG